MTNITHIIPEPPNIKNNIKKVEKRVRDASDEISKAKKELNDANYSELSYEINQLESMYKKTNQYASEFETFASKVETMVNEYITTDKSCANRIRSNGKSHRQKTGLPKGFGAALIASSFEKLGDWIEDKTNDIESWVDRVLESIPIIKDVDDLLRNVSEWINDIPILGFFSENWKEIAGIALNLLQIGLGVCAVASGVGVVPGIISIIMGWDKIVGTVIFDGKTTVIKELIPDFIPDWIVNIGYDGVDIVSVGLLGKAAATLSTINKIDRYADLIMGSQKILGNTNKAKLYLDIIINDGDGFFNKLGNDLYKKLWKLTIKNYSYNTPDSSNLATNTPDSSNLATNTPDSSDVATNTPDLSNVVTA